MDVLLLWADVHIKHLTHADLVKFGQEGSVQVSSALLGLNKDNEDKIKTKITCHKMY